MQENERYLRELEEQGQLPGNGKLVKPEPVFCVKTVDSATKKKVFINVCKSE